MPIRNEHEATKCIKRMPSYEDFIKEKGWAEICIKRYPGYMNS